MDVTTLLSYAIGIAIPLFALYLIYALDLYGTGKFSTILLSFIWGAVGAFGLAYVVNTAVIQSRILTYAQVTRFSAPFAEEILKSAILVFFITQPRFRYIVDGALYGFGAGIGFAVTENVFYIANNSDTTLVLAISRAISTTLMHATASGLVGIALGRLRRSQSPSVVYSSVFGLILAIILHMIFNNVVGTLNGAILLLVAAGIGLGGGGLIAVLMNQGLKDEKKRFETTLGTSVGVSSRERKAVQQLGENSLEIVLKELGEFFGFDKVEPIRRLIVLQANIGILNNNLQTPASERLKKAWEQEIKTLRAEADEIRQSLGVYVMSFVRDLLPSDDDPNNNPFSKELVKSDPTVVHTFDIFMNASALAGTFTPEQLEEYADLLKQVEFFKEVELVDLENLSRAIFPRTYSPGQLIFNEGAEGDSMYLIRQGTIDLFTRVGGEERLLRTCHPGEVVGELALLDGQPRSAKATAGAALTVLTLRREQFMMFISSRPQVILAMLQFLAKRVRHVTNLVETGISWAREVADGNYEKAVAVGGALAPSTGLPTVEAVAPTVAASATDKRETGPGTSPGRIGGAFSMIASALEQREKEAEKKFTETGSLGHEVSTLPDGQREVVRFLMQDPAASLTGVTVELLQKRLPDVTGLPDIIAELVKKDWLMKVGVEPNLRYKANLQRKKR